MSSINVVQEILREFNIEIGNLEKKNSHIDALSSLLEETTSEAKRLFLLTKKMIVDFIGVIESDSRDKNLGIFFSGEAIRRRKYMREGTITNKERVAEIIVSVLTGGDDREFIVSYDYQKGMEKYLPLHDVFISIAKVFNINFHPGGEIGKGYWLNFSASQKY